MKNYLIIIVLVAIIAFAVAYNKKISPVDIVNDVGPLVSEDNAVVVGDQKPGKNITIHYVKLKKPGYVKVYKVDNTGTKTSIGASNLLPAGEHYDVIINAVAPTENNENIVAELTVDNGDGIFNETDKLATDDVSGNAISSDAVIDESAPEDIDIIQEAKNDGYTVAGENTSNDTTGEIDEQNMSDEAGNVPENTGNDKMNQAEENPTQ